MDEGKEEWEGKTRRWGGQGIPTTRAGAVVISETLVLRDPLSRGTAVVERCAALLRMAPSFLRFGSFEIFHKRDSLTGI